MSAKNVRPISWVISHFVAFVWSPDPEGYWILKTYFWYLLFYGGQQLPTGLIYFIYKTSKEANNKAPKWIELISQSTCLIPIYWCNHHITHAFRFPPFFIHAKILIFHTFVNVLSDDCHLPSTFLWTKLVDGGFLGRSIYPSFDSWKLN